VVGGNTAIYYGNVCTFLNIEFFIMKNKIARHWWLTPVILAIQEAEIRRIAV
jgi:hypothetical protein